MKYECFVDIETDQGKPPKNAYPFIKDKHKGLRLAQHDTTIAQWTREKYNNYWQ